MPAFAPVDKPELADGVSGPRGVCDGGKPNVEVDVVNELGSKIPVEVGWGPRESYRLGTTKAGAPMRVS